MPHHARILQLGDSQAVRLPKEYRFDVELVEVTREGNAIILRPSAKHHQSWSSLRAALERGISSDFTNKDLQQPNEFRRVDDPHVDDKS